MDHSPLPVVRAVGMVSHWFDASVKSYLVRRVNTLFGEWVEDATRFRGVMERTSTVLSGSTVLEFMLAENWGPKNLNLYAPLGEGCRVLVQHLTETEGYNLAHTWSNGSVSHNSAQINAILKFTKTVPGRDLSPVTKNIDVIECLIAHPLPPILRFHATFAMNCIASNSIFVAYPHLTFSKRGLIHERMPKANIGTQQVEWMEKYKARGFQLMRGTDEFLGPCGTACPTRWRSIQDVGCMVVPYGDGKVVDFDEVRWTLSSNGIKRRDRCGNQFCCRTRILLPRRDGEPPNEHAGYLHYTRFLEAWDHSW